MVRSSARSRACATCKQRKIRCDEKLPECSQCLKAGKACPGPLQGTLFIDVKDHARVNAGVRDNRPTSKTPEVHVLERSTSSTPSSSSSEGQAITGSTALVSRSHSDEFRLPSSYQPSRAQPFQDLFLDALVNTFLKARTRDAIWAYEIPPMVARSTSPAFVNSFHAAIMGVYGKRTGNQSIQLAARQTYTIALKDQMLQMARAQQQLAAGGDVAQIFSLEMINAAIMFSMFETMNGTTYAAWVQHTLAAGKMIELLGPERCQTGLLNTFVRVIRSAIVYIGVPWKVDTVFASRVWCEVPFLKTGKSSQDRVFNVLLQIPRCLIQQRKMIDLDEAGSHTEAQAIRKQLQKLAWTYLAELEKMTDHLHNELGLAPYRPMIWEETAFRAKKGDWVLHGPEQNIEFWHPADAALMADYDTAVMLCRDLLVAVDPANEFEHNKVVATCVESILVALRWLESRGRDSGGDSSLIFPLKTSYHTTPSTEQQQRVRAKLSKWGTTRNLDGITEFFTEFNQSNAFTPRKPIHESYVPDERGQFSPVVIR